MHVYAPPAIDLCEKVVNGSLLPRLPHRWPRRDDASWSWVYSAGVAETAQRNAVSPEHEM